MEQSETKKSQKIPFFFCEKCEYKTANKKDFNKHLITPKHKNETIETENETFCPKKSPNTCLCSASFHSRTTLWRHKKKCPILNQEFSSTSLTIPQKSPEEVAALTQLVLEVVKSNSEFQKQMFDMVKSGNVGNNMNYSHNHTNSHNKTFNLQVFLNETCKDAMNITDFVDSLQIQLSDLEKVGKDGFVNGISSIIMKNLKALDYTQRPVHCSDQKREVMYVKDQNQWSKEDPDNQKLKKAIKQIAHKNICLIPEWKAKYPDCIYADSKKSDMYNHIVYEAMDNNVENSEKIIKKIAKEVGITK
jgi:hypothetical protein